MKRIHKIIHLQESTNFKNKLLSWAQQFDKIMWFDSNVDHSLKDQKYSNFDIILAIGAEEEIDVNYNNAFNKLKIFQKNINDYIFGYFGYDLKNDTEELKSKRYDGLNFSDLYFYQPKKIFFIRGKTIELAYLNKYEDEINKDLQEINDHVNEPSDKLAHRVDMIPRISKRKYFQKLGNILDHIHRGDIYEVNFCQEFYATNTIINPLNVYQKLNDLSGPPFATFFKTNDQYLLSASPERFVLKQGKRIISQPIKGTAKRVSNIDGDKKMARQLERDSKERAENIMIVDLVRNDLSKTAIKGSVNVEELCKVYSFKQVHQLISTLVSTIDNKTSSIDVIKSLFPMGSMTGAPKISAMKVIEEHEETKRGLYSGAVGYFTPDDDFDFSVVIRSILYNQRNKYVSFSVGGAITAQSTIENEYEECLLKSKAMKKALNL